MNDNNGLLWRAARRLGYVPERVPRNVKNCVDCGNCALGCPYDAKQSTGKWLGPVKCLLFLRWSDLVACLLRPCMQ